jgi:transcriptional regulator with XRE-family HTH domain
MDNPRRTVSDLVAERIREIRVRRGLTAEDLAARCAKAGAPEITKQVLYKLESRQAYGRAAPREVRVDELVVLAYALDCAPVHLLCGLDDDAEFPVTPEMAVPAKEARNWMRGWPHSRDGLPGTDANMYRACTPETEDVMVTMPENEFDQLVARARGRRSA